MVMLDSLNDLGGLFKPKGFFLLYLVPSAVNISVTMKTVKTASGNLASEEFPECNKRVNARADTLRREAERNQNSAV